MWGWSHVSGTELQELLSNQDYTLVAFIGVSFPSLVLDLDIVKNMTKWMEVTSQNCIAQGVKCMNITEGLDSPATFVKRSLRPAVSGLGAENVTDFSSTDDYVFILHLTDADAGKGLYKRFHDLATMFRDRYSFGVVPAKEQGGASTLECYNSPDEVQRSTQNLVDDFNSLKGFFEICTSRMIPEMTRENKKYFTEGTGNVLYYFGSHSDDRERFSSSLRETVRKHIKDLEFVTVDPVAFPEVPANIGLKWNFPAIALQDKSRGLVFPSEKNDYITPSMVENSLRSFKDGNTSPSLWDPVEIGTKDEDLGVETSNEEVATHDEL
ncbi:uncharacterized protein GLRG_01737 [Colletotrichum graminicola M1.001]|uniref:Protein disulfide-isomerase n=1 Tax=Colletotrichum graminicola (strain M1.001 / M2 / FGSC 10212) TaxID=645133 RepID=E3Q963_COLGM|nr:uncharacterized protein GLRG_01737 [Colletotrichum graminicola M1.001]EFQ27242.1 hypothetical protein GLRG_01737 [Colletotrichum graminicola M1.001]